MDLADHRDHVRRDLHRRAARQDLHRGAGAVDAVQAARGLDRVGLAFGVQTLVAVTVGALATLLPDDAHQERRARDLPARRDRAVPYGARRGRRGEGAGGGVRGQGRPSRKSFVKAAVASFLVLFAAEWGDLSQLLTISFVAKLPRPLNVFIGAWAALLTVSRAGRHRRPGAAALHEALGAALRRRGGLPAARRRSRAVELVDGLTHAGRAGPRARRMPTSLPP